MKTTDGGEAGFAQSAPMQAVGRYTGRRIDLDLKDADVHNILRFLADIGRVNIVTADDVSGNITIRMRNVPWDQALDVVLQAKGLGMVRQGNLIRVAPLAVLQKERELELARHKQELDLAPLETRLIPVSYATAEELQARAKDLLSPRGSIAVDPRTNVLIARDISGNLNHVEELVRALDTQTPQVLVEARIVEATSKYLRDVGIQWGGDATFSEATGNPTGVAFPSRLGVAGGNYDQTTPTAGLSPFTRNIPNPNFAVNLPAAVGTDSGGALGFSLGSVDNNINLNLRLSAAESSGMLRIVSSPRILTLDNREARIAQGTLLPFSQVSAQGVQTTFQEAKLQLLVRPHVTADGVGLDAREDQPRRARLHADVGARRPHHLEARGRDRSAHHGWAHGCGHRRHLHPEHRPELGPDPVLRRHPDPRRPIPAAASQRRARRARDLPDAPHREPRRSPSAGSLAKGSETFAAARGWGKCEPRDSAGNPRHLGGMAACEGARHGSPRSNPRFSIVRRLGL